MIDRVLHICERASRIRLSVSAYIRNCVERDLEQSAAAEEELSVWRAELPQDVRELIGLAGCAAVDDRAESDAYHDYLAEKYS